MEPAARQAPARTIADRLHSAAIHLLRRLRVEDKALGLSGPRASALSVLVFRGPLTMSQLAEAEQVRRPTITRLVDGLERRGLVRRVSHAGGTATVAKGARASGRATAGRHRASGRRGSAGTCTRGRPDGGAAGLRNL